MKRHLAAAMVLAGAAGLAVAQTVPNQPGTTVQVQRGGAVGVPGVSPNTQQTVGMEIKREVTDVPVRRVVLFSSGVGFFQHSGNVTGNAATELRFKTEQINDILKSLVVSDTSANGGVKSITYGSQNPIARTLRSFQIDISTNPTLAGIVNQIRGTKISVTLQDEKVEGTVLGVEEKDRPVGKPEDAKVVRVSFVNLITATGIRSVQLDDVRRIEIMDEALQKELDQALMALAQSRDKDKKPVIVNFDGDGTRQVTVAYLVETPVWKTSYRLILPDATSRDSSVMLGWAIVENQTDNDWNNVTLDLVGGRPISFIQDLYQPLYVPRPRVQPRTYASLTPQTYDDGVDASLARAPAATPPAAPGAARGGGGFGGGGGGGAGGRGRGPGASVAEAAGAERQFRLDAADAADAPMDFAQGVRSVADASKVGEMFQYSVKGVTLPRQRSSMIPIITQSVPFDRISIYNRSVLAKNALLGVRLKNETKDYLLAGPIAVLDKVRRADGSTVDSYAGDASIDDMPPGQERLLSYAIDQELLVDSNKQENRTRLMTGSIVKGVLHLKYTDSSDQEYILENKGEREKQVVLEDPILAGYELKVPAKSLEKTERVYRFQVPVPAKQSIKFNVLEERVRGEQMAILPMDVGAIDVYVRTAEIPARVKEVLRTAGDKRKAMIDIERKIARREQERARFMQEQENTRQNIRVLPPNTEVYRTAIADLSTREEEIKKANGEIKEWQTALEKAREELEAYLGDMSVE